MGAGDRLAPDLLLSEGRFGMAKKILDALPMKGKRVLARVDFNVPLDEDRNITDDRRIRMALPTIKCALDGGARLVLMSHQIGRASCRERV